MIVKYILTLLTPRGIALIHLLKQSLFLKDFSCIKNDPHIAFPYLNYMFQFMNFVVFLERDVRDKYLIHFKVRAV